MTSPVFDFTDLTNDPILQFRHIFNLFGDFLSYDQHFVSLSIDGGPFELLGAVGDPGSLNWYDLPPSFFAESTWFGNSGPSGQWRTASHAIDGGAGHFVQLRWTMITDLPGFEGAGIDDVTIYEPTTEILDVSLAATAEPASGPFLGSAEPLTVTLSNLGSTTVASFPVGYMLSGPTSASQVETFAGPLAPGATAPFTFTTPLDLGVPGSYTLTVVTALAGDLNPQNNLLTTTIVHQPTIANFPYSEDFEAGDGGFIEGGVGTWEVGAPSGNFIDGAGSGASAWVTNLDGDHAPGTSWLQSPAFDCTGFTHDPLLQFEHIYELGQGAASWVEVSLDGGPFTKLGQADDPGSTNWYVDPQNDWWDGTSGSPGTWRNVRHLIPGAAGKVVVVRWILDAQGIFQQEGVGVDAVELFETPIEGGQPSQAGVALLDISEATNLADLPPCLDLPGPYTTFVSVNGTLDFRIEGPPDVPVILFYGRPNIGAATTLSGQFDIAPMIVFANGNQPLGINSLFVTNPAGLILLSTSVPASLLGFRLGFQALVPDGSGGFQLTNAVFVGFLP